MSTNHSAHFGSFQTRQQVEVQVQDEIAAGEREYRRAVIEDAPRHWETDEPDAVDLL